MGSADCKGAHGEKVEWDIGSDDATRVTSVDNQESTPWKVSRQCTGARS